VTAPFSGGCACGSIRYVCSRRPVAMLNCHCLDCQRSSGAPFASGFIVRVSEIAITGTPKTYSVRAGGQRQSRDSQFLPRLWLSIVHSGRGCAGSNVRPICHTGQSVGVSADAGYLDIQCATVGLPQSGDSPLRSVALIGTASSRRIVSPSILGRPACSELA